ncbi:MAG: carbonic anhydrase family protein [Chloroflexi bacterium]|nr:carbonic anhydrase family protein [Chloroflexota bacterium]
MNKERSLILLSTVALLVGFAALLTTSLAGDKDWGYSGEYGPEHWGALSPDYALCADGRAQSPVDIRNASKVDLVDIAFGYGESANNIFNNGHTIQVNVDEGSYIIYNEITYKLLQFHFHSPSEHTINGKSAAMEIHFVHADANSGALAVVGILLAAGEAESEAYAAIFDNMPSETGEPAALGEALDLAALLPEEFAYFTYQGSLTTPPCSEIVRWLLLDTPVLLSQAQISAFTDLYAYNARPTLPLGKRDLLLDTQ